MRAYNITAVLVYRKIWQWFVDEDRSRKLELYNKLPVSKRKCPGKMSSSFFFYPVMHIHPFFKEVKSWNTSTDSIPGMDSDQLIALEIPWDLSEFGVCSSVWCHIAPARNNIGKSHNVLISGPQTSLMMISFICNSGWYL